METTKSPLLAMQRRRLSLLLAVSIAAGRVAVRRSPGSIRPLP